MADQLTSDTAVSGSQPISNLDTAFERGNYVHAAAQYSDHDWRKFAALGLIGKTPQAVRGLSLSNNSEARFYLGATLWIAGEQQLAEKALLEAGTPRAENLLRLIQKPKLNVLAQFLHGRSINAIRDKKFSLKTIGPENSDISSDPYTAFERADLEDFEPDFFVCNMIEWHDIPLDLWKMGVPMFGATSDYDAHIQNIANWFPAFDNLIVTCGSAWHELSRWNPAPVSTFPKIFGLDDPILTLNTGERPTDIFVSGFLWHPYNYDKVELIHKALALKINKFICWQGNESLEKFYEQLNKTKATWSFVRRADEVPTRALDSLAHGCAVAIQRDSVLNLYLGEEDGLESYTSPQDLGTALEKITSNWSLYQQRARRGSEKVRREWARPVTTSQYLRFLTVLASNRDLPRKKTVSTYLPQKEFLYVRGAIQPLGYRLLKQILLLSKQDDGLRNAASPHELLDTARECSLAAARYHYAPAIRRSELPCEPKDRLLVALDLYKLCSHKFLNALVPRFNMVRVAMHLGDAMQVSEALVTIREVISKPPNYWQVDTLEDVFPFDFFPMHFNYREYLDTITRQYVNGEPARGNLIRLILASMYSYLGHYVDPLENFKTASTYDPNFDYYRLRFAESLAGSPDRQAVVMGANLLKQLCEKSCYLIEAFAVLTNMERKGVIDATFLAPYREKVSRYQKCCVDYEHEDWLKSNLQRAAYIP